MKRESQKIFRYLTIILIIGLISFFGIQYFTKTGIFRIPGVVYYDESLSAEEIKQLQKL